MDRKVWFATSFVAVLLLALAPSPALADHTNLRDVRWACGGFGAGHPNACGIDPVGGDAKVGSDGDPMFLAPGPDDWIPDDARVLGINHNDDVRAYPVRMLNTHEIVNDVVGGDPLSVTFCPLCGSGVSFHRTLDLDGEVVVTNFTASGYLYRTDMVMWDPESGQLWNQITGSVIASLHDNQPQPDHLELQLDFVPTTVTTWGAWKDKHPDTLLLQPLPGYTYRENAYTVTDADDCHHGFSGVKDCDVNGLHPKEQMIAVDLGNEQVAFPVRFVALEDSMQATHITSSGRTLIATADLGGGGTITDADSGEVLPSTHMFWFAWVDHHPDTELWLPAGGLPGTDVRETPGPTMLGAAGVVLTALLLFRATRKQL